VLLVEDVAGKGHVSRVTSDVDSLALLIALERADSKQQTANSKQPDAIRTRN
jgi:hypothetical protein